MGARPWPCYGIKRQDNPKYDLSSQPRDGLGNLERGWSEDRYAACRGPCDVRRIAVQMQAFVCRTPRGGTLGGVLGQWTLQAGQVTPFGRFDLGLETRLPLKATVTP